MIQTNRIFAFEKCWPPIIGILYFFSAMLSLELTRSTTGTATVWLASGVLAGGLMLATRRGRIAIVALVAIASFVTNFRSGTGAPLSMAYTIANLVEGFVVVLLAKRGGAAVSFGKPAEVGRFCLAALAGAAVSGVLASVLTSLAGGSWNVGFLISWMATVVLGLLIITPLTVTMAQAFVQRRRTPRKRRLVEMAVVPVIVIGVNAVTFFQHEYPLLFLPLCAVFYATYRFGTLGGAASVATAAIVGTVAGIGGLGPLAMVPDNTATQVWFFQLYLLVLLATALPLAAMQAARDKLHAETMRRNIMQDMAEKAAHVGHWRLEPATGRIDWSDETFRIQGLEPGGPKKLDDGITAYHEDDRAMVTECVTRAIEDREPFEFCARVILPDGSIAHVESRGEVDLDGDGEVQAVYGIIQDVSERVSTLQALEDARRAAEKDANTDALTGVANRRHAMAMLENEIERASRHGHPLSIAMLDVDHFKSINDRYGHGVGDEALRRIAQICRKHLRKCDLVGRLGGEEFVFVLPETSPDAAMVVVERIRLAISALHLEGTDGHTMTASFGVAGWHAGNDADFLLHAADDALYEAKRGGRNQLRLAA